MKRIASVALLLGSAACFYPSDRGKLLESRVDKLEIEKKDLQAQLAKERADLQARLPPMDAAIHDLQARLDKLDHAARTSDADIGVQMESVREDLAKLRGMVDEYQHHIDLLDAGIKQLSDDTDEKLAALKGNDALRLLEARKKASALPRPTDKNAFLKLADAQLQAGSGDVAMLLYGEFLQKWPTDPLAARAHFALGKTYQDQSRCREALAEYGEVIKKFSRSDRAAPALLHSSDCFATLSMRDESRLALEELEKDYPHTAEGKQAKDRLKKAAAPKKPGHKKK